MIPVSVQRAMRRAGENGGWWLAVIIWCGAVIGALAVFAGWAWDVLKAAGPFLLAMVPLLVVCLFGGAE